MAPVQPATAAKTKARKTKPGYKMTVRTKSERILTSIPKRRSALEFLGGKKLLARDVETPMDAHLLLKDGLPTVAFNHLVHNVRILGVSKHFQAALGMSVRTQQRLKSDKATKLSPEQSGRTWKFAEVLAKACDVLGSQEAAEDWLTKPATALDRRTPLEMLETPAGLEVVQDLLTRLDYGVYT